MLLKKLNLKKAVRSQQMNNGIYKDITIQAYHENRTHISATSIKAARKSLSLWRYNQLNPQKWEQHFDFGNAFEIALFDKTNFEKLVAVIPMQKWIDEANAERLKEKKAAYDKPKNSAYFQSKQAEFLIEHRGKYFIPDVGEQGYDTLKKMVDSCERDPTIQKLLSGVEFQLSLFWTDEITGLNLKTRPDVCQRKRNVIVNLKTCIDGSPESFSRELARYEYPIQAAIEIKGCLATGLMDTVDFYYWLVVEKEPPFNATLYAFDQKDQEWVFDELGYTLGRMRIAKERNVYPGYTDRADNQHGILTAVIPAYYRKIF